MAHGEIFCSLSTGGGESHIEFKSPNAKKNMQLVAKAREGCVESIGYTWNATGNGFFPHTPSIFSQQGSKTCESIGNVIKCAAQRISGAAASRIYIGDDLDLSSYCDCTAVMILEAGII